MKTKLLNKVKDENKDELRSSFMASKYFRETLIEILNDEFVVLQNSMLNEDTLESKNWGYYQCDRVAQMKLLRKMIDYLK